MPIAGVAERDLELAAFDALAAFDPVGRGNGHMQERAGALGFGALDACSDVAAGDRVLLRELEAQLVEHIARDLFFNMGQRELLQHVVQHAVARFHLVFLEVALRGFEGAADRRDRTVGVGKTGLFALGQGVVT